MPEQFTTAIAALQDSLRLQEKEVRETKRVINKLCAQDGKPPLYPEADQEGGLETVGIQRDSFYSLSMPVAIKKYLEGRRSVGRGPATVAEIIEALTAGGFQWGEKDETAAKTGIYVSLAKNSYLFHRIRGGRDEAAVYGLKAWYPGAKDEDEEPAKKKGKAKAKAKGKKADAAPPPQDDPPTTKAPKVEAPVGETEQVNGKPRRKGAKGVA